MMDSLLRSQMSRFLIKVFVFIVIVYVVSWVLIVNRIHSLDHQMLMNERRLKEIKEEMWRY